MTFCVPAAFGLSAHLLPTLLRPRPWALPALQWYCCLSQNSHRSTTNSDLQELRTVITCLSPVHATCCMLLTWDLTHSASTSYAAVGSNTTTHSDKNLQRMVGVVQDGEEVSPGSSSLPPLPVSPALCPQQSQPSSPVCPVVNRPQDTGI